MASTAAHPSRFERALVQVLAQEGGFSLHPQDPGGATNLGITRRTLAETRGHPVSVEDVRRLTRDEAAAIYRRFYWDRVQADALPPGLDLAVFDLAVNSGPGQAACMLQKALGVPADGMIGPLTLGAARDVEAADAIRRLTQARLAFLSRLSTWPVFGRGWARRVRAVERESLRLAASPSPTSNG